jgi:hypothetical protein
MIHFKFRASRCASTVFVRTARPFMSSIFYELIMDTEEDDRRLDLQH